MNMRVIVLVYNCIVVVSLNGYNIYYIFTKKKHVKRLIMKRNGID